MKLNILIFNVSKISVKINYILIKEYLATGNRTQYKLYISY